MGGKTFDASRVNNSLVKIIEIIEHRFGKQRKIKVI